MSLGLSESSSRDKLYLSHLPCSIGLPNVALAHMTGDKSNRRSEDDDILAPSVLGSDAENSDPRSSPTKEKRQIITTIAEAANLLSSRKDVELDRDDISLGDDDDDESIVLEDGDALAELHFAATRRRNLDRTRVREARIVEPVYGKEDIHAVPVQEEISQKEVMWRMMRALSKNEQEHGGSGRAALEKKIRRLHANGKKALSVPLPAPVQGRLERASAYDNTKEKVGMKWAGIVQQNRRTKQLVFPLNRPGRETGGNTSSIVGSFKPETNYEEEIDSLLREAGVSTDQDVLKQEENGAGDLETAPITKKEVLKRRRELAKVRSLMFHYEHKMKRIKKIKSKKYRRVMKKEKEKLAQTMGDSDDEETKERRAEQKRVEERMTLRHKNTSKWVRRQLQRKEANRNPTTRAAIEEQLRMHEELRRRQESEVNNSETSDEEACSGESSDDDNDIAEKEALRQELARSDRQTNRKGVMGMRFMIQAQERKRKQALALLEEMSQEDGEQLTEEASRPTGRQSFQGQQSKISPESMENGITDQPGEIKNRVEETMDRSHRKAPSPLDTSVGGNQMHDTDRNADGKSGRSSVGYGFTTKLNGRLSVEVNPWLANSGEYEGQTSKLKNNRSNNARETEHSGGHSEENPPLQATVSQKGRSPSIRLTSNPLGPKEEVKKNAVSSKKRQRLKGNETQLEDSTQKEGPIPGQPDDELLRMQDIAQAFAGVGGADQAEFDAAKQSEVERSMPTAQTLQAEVLPGWGSWDGAGMPKAKRRRAETPFAKAARERLEAARANTANKRSDRTMRNVILNEKRIKQATDLTLSSVPFPFTSRDQWQREVDTSICRELQSTASFRDAIGKRVVAKPGTVIEPIRRSESDKSYHHGKRGVITLRKERSERRTKARRGLMT